MAPQPQIEPELTCPSCGTKIKLTESLAAPLVAATEAKYKEILQKKDEDAAKRESKIAKRGGCT